MSKDKYRDRWGRNIGSRKKGGIYVGKGVGLEVGAGQGRRDCRWLGDNGVGVKLVWEWE